MIFSSTSIKNVIARVARNVNNQLPGHYLDSMLEWIPEAMEELETPYQMDTLSTPSYGCAGALYTSGHVAKLPCGLVYLIAVEDAYGKRVREGMDVTDITSQTTAYHTNGNNLSSARTTDFQKDVLGTSGTDPAVSGPSTPYDGSDIVPVKGSGNPAYYKIQMGYIQTSEEEMFIKLHYAGIPVDNEGYPLVPDVTEYKEALYWYILEKMVGSGYKHPVIPANVNGMEYCRQKYEAYASRALGKIKTPTQDRMAQIRDGFSLRLIPPYHFYDDFGGIGGEQRQQVNF